MKPIFILPFSVLFLLFPIAVHSQVVMTSSGGHATGTGGSSSYSVGQLVILPVTGAKGSVVEGIQQPYEISTTAGVEEKEIHLELLAYPNPTSNALTLRIGNYNNEKLTYHLLDMQGKLLDRQSVITQTTTIRMQHLPVSTYLLRVVDNNSLIKTFRIIKK